MHRLVIVGCLVLAGCGGDTAMRNETVAAAPAIPASCRAGQFQAVIGRHEVILQTMDLPPLVRIYQQGSPIPQDANPGRLNFVFDGQRIIRQVSCG